LRCWNKKSDDDIKEDPKYHCRGILSERTRGRKKKEGNSRANSIVIGNAVYLTPGGVYIFTGQ